MRLSYRQHCPKSPLIQPCSIKMWLLRMILGGPVIYDLKVDVIVQKYYCQNIASSPCVLYFISSIKMFNTSNGVIHSTQ